MKIKSITTEDGQEYEIGGEYEFSYDGETWRKGIFESIKKYPDGYFFQTKDYNNTSIRHIPKPEPKFKVGDMVKTRYGDIVTILACDDGKYSVAIDDVIVAYTEDYLELYTPPEMIDLPEGIEFSSSIGEISIGIIFNSGKQDLHVHIEKKVYRVVDTTRQVLSFNKQDYCLIKSTREECMQAGVVFFGHCMAESDTKRMLNYVDFWSIALNNNIVVNVSNQGGVEIEEVNECAILYKLTKRSEVA